MTILTSPAPHSPILANGHWPDEAACQRTAEQLADALGPVLQQGGSAIIELQGTLGAGKTTFTRHLLRAMGVTGRIKSPSYAVVEPHETTTGVAHHFDFYRFNDPQEWEDAGFRDIFAAPGLKLVEWPDKAAGLMPAADLVLAITPDTESSRTVTATAVSPKARVWLQKLTDFTQAPSLTEDAPDVAQGGSEDD